MSRLNHLAALLAVVGITSPVRADELDDGFRNPPQQARPMVYWNWLNGNVTLDGITRDFEWMQRVGIAGVLNFEADLGTPVLIPQRVHYRTKEWQDLIGHTAAEADRLNLEYYVLASPGWSETGGPWVRPEEGMKKLVWAETHVRGGRKVGKSLIAAPTVTGAYQDMPAEPPFAIGPPEAPRAVPQHARNVAVLAFPSPDSDLAAPPAPRITTNGGPLDAALLGDGSFSASQTLTFPGDGGRLWVRFDYGSPLTMRSLTLGTAQAVPFLGNFLVGAVEVSDDDVHYRQILALPDGKPSGIGSGFPAATMTLPATTARYWRVAWEPRLPSSSMEGSPYAISSNLVYELAFHAGARVNLPEIKAGSMVGLDLDSIATPPLPQRFAVDPARIVDVTAALRPDGSLDWVPPKGRWTILNFGYSLTGRENHPAPVDARGLEVDKLNAAHVRRYTEEFLRPMLDAAGPHHGSRGLRGIEADSYEVGSANWTEDMARAFSARRGYDLTKWLPAVAGFVVGDADRSDRFLADLRRTIADLTADNHHAVLRQVANEHGMQLWSEAMGPFVPAVADALQLKRNTDVPMGEFWQVPQGQPMAPAYVADTSEAASSAHVYGKPYAAAESFTAMPTNPAFATAPWQLKPLADQALAQGIGRFVIHTSAHQATENAPGITLGPFGQYFTRHEAWGELARGWTDYLARSSFMAQQGQFVADIAYFYGEDPALSVRTDLVRPKGFGMDILSKDAILDQLSVQDGAIVTPSGMRYRILVLPPELKKMSLPVLEKLKSLVEAGATLLGPRPQAGLGLMDDDQHVKAMAGVIWGTDGQQPHRLGRGQVYSKGNIEDVLASHGVEPDFTAPSDAPLVTFHRSASGAEIWFVANRSDKPVNVTASFRISGREAEIWRADSGAVSPSAYTFDGSRTLVPLELAGYDAQFVVFRKATDVARRTMPASRREVLLAFSGPWDVSFQSGRGAPAAVRLPQLAPLSDNPDPGVRYFSGQATYRRTFTLPAHGNGPLVLDLGRVGEVARVRVNGCEAGYAWKPPYEVDIARCVMPGTNVLTVDVGNLWVNRLIGDAQPGATPIAQTTFPFADGGPGAGFLTGKPYTSASPLVPSGLIGPVRIVGAAPVPRGH
ncbi:MAG: glycosyl hydrolase [Novosphingobium sp.]